MTTPIDTPTILHLAARIRAPWRTPAGAVLLALVPPTLEHLATGEAVSPEEIALAAGRSPEEVRAALGQLVGVDRDERGRVAGLGLTLRPTPHRVELGGRTLFAWCALDTLIFPALLGRPARVESPCRGTGEPVRVEATPSGVEAVEPASAVVSIVAPRDLATFRGALCENVHFFRSSEAASSWLERHPEASILPVEEAFRLGRLIAEDTFRVSRSLVPTAHEPAAVTNAAN
jgi:alkylmercury lyase